MNGEYLTHKPKSQYDRKITKIRPHPLPPAPPCAGIHASFLPAFCSHALNPHHPFRHRDSNLARRQKQPRRKAKKGFKHRPIHPQPVHRPARSRACDGACDVDGQIRGRVRGAKLGHLREHHRECGGGICRWLRGAESMAQGRGASEGVIEHQTLDLI